MRGSKGYKTNYNIQTEKLRSEYKDCTSPSTNKDEDLSNLLWKIKLAAINTEESDHPLEDDSQLARTQSISPYLLDCDKNGHISGPGKLSSFTLGNISDSSLHSDSTSHRMPCTYVEPANEDALALFPDSYSSCTLFSNVSPSWRISESISPVSPIEKHFKASLKKTTKDDRRTGISVKVVMLVLLAHLEHVHKYACLVRDLLRLYSIDVESKVEEEGSSILPEHVAFIASRMPETTRIMLIGPRHVLDGTCHFQTWDGRCIESTIFSAINYLLEESVPLPLYQKRNLSFKISPYCSSVNVFVNKMVQRLNTRHSLHSQLLELISVCQSCSRLFQKVLKQQYASRSQLIDTLVSALHETLPRGFCCIASYHSKKRSLTRKTLYLLSMMRHWELHIAAIREKCIQLYLQLSNTNTFQTELEKEMRLDLLSQVVDKCNVLDKIYQEMKQFWESLVRKVL